MKRTPLIVGLLFACSVALWATYDPPGGDDTTTDYPIVGGGSEGQSNNGYPLATGNGAWKRCALQGFGPMATTSPYTLTYSFFAPGTPLGYTPPTSGPFVAFSAGAKATIRNAFNSLEVVNATHRDFVEVPDTATTWGQIRFWLVDANLGAWAITQPVTGGTFALDQAGDISIRAVYDLSPSVDWRGFQSAAPGTHGYLNVLHEIGHALGLKHPFESAAVPAHPDRPDCFFGDGGDPYQDASHAPGWVATGFRPSWPTPAETTFCGNIDAPTRFDSSKYSIMTYAYRHFCVGGAAPSDFAMYDKVVLKDWYWYNNGQ